jgi:hypothetical protein
LGTETGKVINGKTLKHMKLIETFTNFSTDLSESNAQSNLMKDFPPICKKDPFEVQMNFIKDHFATSGKVIRLEDVPEEMYGGDLPVARSKMSKRKAITKDEYLEDAPELPFKKAKKEKKEKAPAKVNVVGPAVPNVLSWFFGCQTLVKFEPL